MQRSSSYLEARVASVVFNLDLSQLLETVDGASHGERKLIGAWLNDDVPEVVRRLAEVPRLPSFQVSCKLLPDTEQQSLSGTSGAF